MHRRAVIRLLGPATWASLPTDKGELALPDASFSLELRWRNPGCTPVAVAFDHEGRVSGWDEGRVCFADAERFEPGAEYSCTKKDRRALCGHEPTKK
jgi:hypothetical protein